MIGDIKMTSSVKYIRRACCGALAILSLTACGKSSMSLDPAETVEQMKDKLTFTDQMTVVDMEGALRIYGVDEALVSDCAALRGSGATAENFSVWKTANEQDAEELEDQLESFLQSWIDGYSDYKPEEVPKLESAVLTQEDHYVILCVSADNEAAETYIDDLLDA